MTGYPPGTKVIITWASPENTCVRIGQVVTVGSYIKPPGQLYWSVSKQLITTSKYWQQELVDVKPTRPDSPIYMHRIDWMRPLSDPDTETQPTEAEVEA